MPERSVRPRRVAGRTVDEILASFASVRLANGLSAGPGEHPEGELPRVTGVASSSFDVRPGDCYVAIAGAKVHGASFADKAVVAGAVAILTDQRGIERLQELGVEHRVPVLLCERPRHLLGPLSAFVYDSQSLTTFGVTGTNGKTTTVMLLEAIQRALGLTTGITTTVERRIGDERLDSELTTPEADVLHALLARMSELSVSAADIEVSAHALTWKRVAGVGFDVVGFLNFSQDHLDDYASIDEYFAAKAELFTPEYAKTGVVCVDDEWGRRLAEEASIPVTTLSATQAEAEWRVERVEALPTETRFTLKGPAGVSLRTRVNLPGAFNALNAALAIVMIHKSGVSFDALTAALSKGIQAKVPGRLEQVNEGSGPRVFIDYAHTPGAFVELLAALRSLTKGTLTMIFGCDGDRDRSKRPAMAQAAVRGADRIVITDYNPRHEAPDEIRRVLLDAALQERPGADVTECASQGEAIQREIARAEAEDTIVVAGPGHERWSHVAGTKIPYSARDLAVEALTKAGWMS